MRYQLLVKPGSKKGPLVVLDGNETLTVYVRERAIEGEANRAVIEVLAKHFGVSKSKVQIVSGQSSKHKRVEIG